FGNRGMRGTRPLTIHHLMEIVRYAYIGGIQCAPPPWRRRCGAPGRRPLLPVDEFGFGLECFRDADELARQLGNGRLFGQVATALRQRTEPLDAPALC